MSAEWAETTDLANLRAQDLAKPAVVFRSGDYLYRTVGNHLKNGGMGAVYEMHRLHVHGGDVEQVVGKTFHANYLHQIRNDDVTRRDHQTNAAALARLAALDHPNILPMYVSSAIADNHLLVTPRMAMTLLEAIAKHKLSARDRIKLLIQAIDGLAILHSARIIHRDFTLRNMLVDDAANLACVFDFDLAVSLDDIGAVSYRNYYRGRIFGSPGWSVAPETIDQSLLDTQVSTACDVYAVGAAIHGLFTDEMMYGAAGDMWGLLVRIGEGVVVGGKSSVHYPDTVPMQLRPVIEACVERDPAQRPSSVIAIGNKLRAIARDMRDDERPRKTAVVAAQPPPAPRKRIRNNTERVEVRDPTITGQIIDQSEHAIWQSGYQVSKSLGRVRNHPIFLAAPREDLIADGQFTDPNTFPKLITVIDLKRVDDAETFVANWQQHFLPVLKRVRSGLLTTLHRVVYDPESSTLLLFTEYVDDPRFGDRIAEVDMHLDGALALGLLVTKQVAALHEQGMAHNNIQPSSLLFKGDPQTRMVQPAMLGLVEPELGDQAMATDVRALSGMVLTWLRPNRIAQLHVRVKPLFDTLRGKLSSWAFDGSVRAPTIDELAGLLSDTFALVDFNYSVLRDSGGDLREYALLVLSLRTYHWLWLPEPHADNRAATTT